MKKTILIMLALALLCATACACSDGGNVNDNKGGIVTDNGGTSNIGDDIKDGANDIMTPQPSPAQPQATAIPGTQVITP